MKLITGIAVLILSAPVVAAEPSFSWAADDLNTPDGVVRTHQRVAETAEAYCREHLEGTRNLSVFRGCTAAVEAEIVGSVNNQALAEYSKTRRLQSARVATR